MPKPRICFVSNNIYPALSEKYVTPRVGGAELQQIFIGKCLHAHGCLVSYVTMDHGQPAIENIDGLKIYKTYKENAGISGLRFFYPRLFKLWRALKRVDADVYYTRCASFMPGVLALFCRVYKKKYIFAGALDSDFIPSDVSIQFKRDKWLYNYGLKKADKIIVQSKTQKNLLKQNFGLKSSIIPNFTIEKPHLSPETKTKHILWVATIRKRKRPEWFVNLARQMPSQEFVMIGGPQADRKHLFKKIKAACEDIPNIRFLGFQPLEVTEQYFDGCELFVNTSFYEGFPNTFLQAWRRGIPVVSSVDPDGVIQKNKLGAVITAQAHLLPTVKTMLATTVSKQQTIIEYFVANHSSLTIEHYMKLISKM
jgi:glycosyltransferase involved in cell wall biosynthesis